MTGYLLSLYGQMEAIKAEIEAMKVTNAERERNGHAFAYTEDDFFNASNKLQSLARDAHNA